MIYLYILQRKHFGILFQKLYVDSIMFRARMLAELNLFHVHPRLHGIRDCKSDDRTSRLDSCYIDLNLDSLDLLKAFLRQA